MGAATRNDVALQMADPEYGEQECAIEPLRFRGRALGVARHEEGLAELVQPVRDFRHRLDQGARVEVILLLRREICVQGARAQAARRAVSVMLVSCLKPTGRSDKRARHERSERCMCQEKGRCLSLTGPPDEVHALEGIEISRAPEVYECREAPLPRLAIQRCSALRKHPGPT